MVTPTNTTIFSIPNGQRDRAPAKLLANLSGELQSPIPTSLPLPIPIPRSTKLIVPCRNWCILSFARLPINTKMPIHSRPPQPPSDHEIGMDRPITRRDFLNGAAMAIGSSVLSPNANLLPGQSKKRQNLEGYYPPASTGLRGSHLGSFEIAHRLRDGTFWKTIGKPANSGEAYDLIVVGAGISGLSAAYFFREQFGPKARILLLENHDDFGGHAKRNEFHLAGKLQLLNGGTMLIDSPTAYSKEASAVIAKLGIDPTAFAKKFANNGFYSSLGL